MEVCREKKAKYYSNSRIKKRIHSGLRTSTTLQPRPRRPAVNPIVDPLVEVILHCVVLTFMCENMGGIFPGKRLNIIVDPKFVHVHFF